MTEENFVECPNHGKSMPAFVCQHLSKSTKIGFYEPNIANEDPEFPTEFESQGWCQECENIREAQFGWNDISEEFANPQLICYNCFLEIKEANCD